LGFAACVLSISGVPITDLPVLPDTFDKFPPVVHETPLWQFYDDPHLDLIELKSYADKLHHQFVKRLDNSIQHNLQMYFQIYSDPI